MSVLRGAVHREQIRSLVLLAALPPARAPRRMTEQQRHQAEQLQRLVAVGAALDRLAAERRERTGTEPPRWQTMEQQRPALAWRLAA